MSYYYYYVCNRRFALISCRPLKWYWNACACHSLDKLTLHTLQQAQHSTHSLFHSLSTFLLLRSVVHNGIALTQSPSNDYTHYNYSVDGFLSLEWKTTRNKDQRRFSERHFKWFCEINIKNNCGRQSVRFNEFTRTATIVEFRKCVLFFWFVCWVRCYAKSLVTRQNEFLFSPSFIIIFGLVLSRYLRRMIDFAEFKGENTYVPLIYFSRSSNKNSNWTYAQQTIPTKN